MAQSSGGSPQRAIALGSLTGTVSFFWSHVFWPWALPIAAPIVTVLLGWAQGVPWMWVWLAALAAPFFALAAMREVGIRRQTNRVDDKLIYSFGAAADHEISEGKRIIKVIQPFVNLLTNAPFGLSVLVDEMETRIDGHAHLYRKGAPPRRIGPYAVSQSRGLQARDIPVDIPDGIKEERSSGTFRFKLRYGVPGKETFEVSERLNFEVINKADAQGVQVLFSPAATDA